MVEAISSAIMASLSALRDAPVIIWRIDAARLTLLCQTHPTQLTAVDVDVLTGVPLFLAFAQAAPEACVALAASLTGHTQTFWNQGSAIDYQSHYQPERNAEGFITGVLVITTLLARRPRAQLAGISARHASHAHSFAPEDCLALLRHAPVAVSLMLNDGDALRYAYANPAYEALIDSGSLAGTDVFEVFADILRKEPDIAGTIRAVSRTGARGLATREHALPGINNRLERYFDFLYEPVFDAQGQPCGMSSFAYEVSQAVHARRAAKATQVHLQALANCTPHLVWTTTPEGVPQYFNERWYEFTGFTKQSVQPDNWIKLCHPEDLAESIASWRAACQLQKPFDYESRLFDRQTKTYRWYLHRAVPAFDDAGKIVQWFGSSTDVDKQKRDQSQVDNILETMNDAFFAIDADWRITRMNPKHLQVTQIPRHQQIGKSLIDLYFSDPSTKDSPYLKHYRIAMRDRVSVSFSDYYPPFDLWLDVNVYPSADGGLAIFSKDISIERRLSRKISAEKQKFEAIFSDSPASMALLRGKDLIFEKVNAKYAELMNHRALVGKSLHEALPELIGQPFDKLMCQVFETGEPFVGSEVSVMLVRRTGNAPEESFFDFTYSRVEDGAGRPYGIYIHATEITEKVMVRHKTERLAASLSEAVQARDEFLSIASHELKTPVTSLKMQLQMTRRAVKPDENKAPQPLKLAKTLDLCCRQVDRLTALIEDLLDVSRVESGKMSFNFEKIEISGLLEEVVERFGEQLKTAGCTVETTYEQDIWVQCDGFRIEQVITNLLTNAIKYAAGAPVQIVARVGPDDGACITVRDEGMGIAKDKQDKVFGRFERAISHNNVSGLGLGLYISKQIVEAHHGQIFVDSELGLGSTFTVLLPHDASGTVAPPDDV